MCVYHLVFPVDLSHIIGDNQSTRREGRTEPVTFAVPDEIYRLALAFGFDLWTESEASL